MGCTVGVVRTADELLFFKNRDLDPGFWGRGVPVPDRSGTHIRLRGTNLATGESQGVSIGLSHQGICVANTHVASTPDMTYDLLCQELLLNVRYREDVAPTVATFVKGQSVQGGRILVAAIPWTCLVEVYRNQYRLEELPGNVVITNTFSLIPGPIDRPQDRARSSAIRLATAERMLDEVRHLDDLKAMLRSHDPRKGNDSICNHRPNGGGTESSHIVQMRDQGARWWHLEGFPCEHDYRVQAPFRIDSAGGLPVAGGPKAC